MTSRENDLLTRVDNLALQTSIVARHFRSSLYANLGLKVELSA